MVAETGGGGGSIRVGPGSLDAAGAALAGTAGEATSLSSVLAQAAPAGACDPRADGACATMQEALAAQVTFLADAARGLGEAVTRAAATYVVTDAQQMGLVP